MATRKTRLITLTILVSAAISGPAYGGTSLSAPPTKKSARIERIPTADSGINGFLAGHLGLREMKYLGYRIHDGFVQIVIKAEPGATQVVADDIAALGARRISLVRDFVQAEMPLDALATAAAAPNVRWIRKPIYAARPEPGDLPVTKGLKSDQTTEGLAPMNAIAWHDAGHNGSGIKVGIIDLEFGGYQSLIGSALPPASRVHYRGFGWTVAEPALVHGTACAEIVYDIAPDAELYLAHVETGVDVFAAIDWLVGNGVEVISMSLGFAGAGPGDGTGPMHDAIAQSVEDDDTLWTVSAGNERKEHWQGRTPDADEDNWIDFDGPTVEINFYEDGNGNKAWFDVGETVDPFLQWNDWEEVTNDYDLHIFFWDGEAESAELVASSEDIQNGGSNQWPREYLSYEVPVAGYYGIAVSKPGATGSHDLEVFGGNSLGAELARNVDIGSISVPSDSPSVISVAAGNFSSPFATHYYSCL